MNMPVKLDVPQATRPWMIEAADGTGLFYRDWAPAADAQAQAAPLVFCAGWGLPSDSWGAVMAELGLAGHRCIAYDRRGAGRSDDPGRGYDLDTLADDLAAVLDALDLTGAVLVGHSMAGAEITRYLSRHGAARVAKVVLIAPVTPCLGRRDDNPNGVDPASFAAVRAAVASDFTGWMDAAGQGFVLPQTAEGTMAWIKALMARGSVQALVETNRAWTGLDLRAEVAAIDRPTLVLAGDNDLSTPLPLTGEPTARLIRGATLKVYPGGPHGLMFTHVAELVADIGAFAA
ncbi:alpha/beta fold hydrolase [Caulobacter sp. KR2-114]|uniref:alpha/beta fold hydrolase n=1 Tax=Caulobacter sp. KR2-114 TaxID=3400912 RepID=UPI003C07AB28